MATILFVCKANRGRSVMSAAFAERLADGRHSALSAGSEADPANRPHPEVITAMREVGIDVSEHRAQPLTTALAAQADAVITMGLR
jgi:arsenate reductase